jgi:hypothetical protein
LIRRIFAGSLSSSMNKTPLISIARSSFRSGAPVYRLGAGFAEGSAAVHRSARPMSVRAVRWSERASVRGASE